MAPTIKGAAQHYKSRGAHSFIPGCESLVKLSDDNSTEMLRMIQQYLSGQGYQEIANQLAQASNVPQEAPHVTNFRDQVLTGKFEDIPTLVASLVRPEAHQ